MAFNNFLQRLVEGSKMHKLDECVVVAGRGSIPFELLPLHPVGPALFLHGCVAGASLCSVRLRIRNPRGNIISGVAYVGSD